MRRLVWLAAVACLGGCDMMTAALKPLPERVNAAFPLPDEVELARTRLLAALDGDPPARAQADAQIRQLMEARALACSAGTSLGRFDTPARIRGKLTDTQCFQRQDAQLEEWVGARRIGLILRAPALVPAAALPAQVLLPNTLDSVASAHLAAEANVLVLRNHQQRFQAVQVPGGKELSAFAVPEGYGRAPSLSPNGRLLAVPAARMLRLVEVESGKVLWATDKYQDLVAWDPKSELLVLAQTGTGAPYMLDTRSGRIDRYPATEKQLTWSLPLGDGRLLAGQSTSASLLQHGRNASGALEVQAARQWTLASSGIGSGVPFLMNQGRKLVYPSNRDLAWLDMASGQQGKWEVSLLSPGNFAQGADHLVAFDVTPPGATAPVTRLLDTDKATIATAKGLDDRGHQVFPLAPRAAFLRRSANAVTLVSAVEGEEPQDLERLIGETVAAREIAKLNDPYRPDFGAPSSLSPERQAVIEALARQVRAANVQSAIRDGLPRETIEAMRRGERPAMVGSARPGEPALAHAGKPILDVPADARVAMLGVYQAAGSSSRPSRSGNINVSVAPGSTPIVLVLASYESVNWVIHPGGRKIAAILLSGYTPSTVNGHGAAQVVRIGSRYAYKIDSREFQDLRRDVARYVGNTTPVFQGLYEGREFQVQ